MGRDLEKQRAYQKAWREKNKEKIQEYNKNYNKEWYQENKLRLREVRRNWRTQNPEKTRLYSLRSYYKHKEKNDERTRQRNLQQPEKRQALTAVMHALQYGKLEKPELCTFCHTNDYRIEGHHHDYSKPLDVTWLCSKCHKNVHAGNINLQQ